MVKHKEFIKGVLFALTIGLGLDLIIIHQLIKHHQLYNSPSVNIVEPILGTILLIIGIIIFKQELWKKKN